LFDSQPYPFLIVLLSLFGTLIGKYLWDRYFSQCSRVTKAECAATQKSCQAEVLLKLKTQGDDLECGDKHFKAIDSKLWVITFALLKICNEMKIDCDDIVKQMAEKGIMN
jgi:hypothetical protein